MYMRVCMYVYLSLSLYIYIYIYIHTYISTTNFRIGGRAEVALPRGRPYATEIYTPPPINACSV